MLAKKKTQNRPRQRVTRVDAPTVEEAIAAAQGLTDDIEGQIEIACQLMGMPEDEVRPVALRLWAKPARSERTSIADRVLDRAEGAKVIVVERRRPRIVAR